MFTCGYPCSCSYETSNAEGCGDGKVTVVVVMPDAPLDNILSLKNGKNASK